MNPHVHHLFFIAMAIIAKTQADKHTYKGKEQRERQNNNINSSSPPDRFLHSPSNSSSF